MINIDISKYLTRYLVLRLFIFLLPLKVFNGIRLCNVGSYDHNVTDKNKQTITIELTMKHVFLIMPKRFL